MRQSIKKNINRLIIFIITLATSFAATTAYINGIDEDYGSATTIRNDVVLLGSVAGGFDGMNVPTGQVNSTTTIYNLMLVDASGGNPIANNNSTNSSGTGNGVFSNNLTDLWITGNASNFATYVTSANYALPVPQPNSAGAGVVPVNIHFLLDYGPSNTLSAWFCGIVPDYTRVIIEPGSADPSVDCLATNFTPTSCVLMVGAPIVLRSSTTSAPCAIQRHPKLFANRTYNASSPLGTKAAHITVNANMNFDKSVHGISLAAASASNFTLNFSDFSSIIDLDATNPFGAMTVAAGMTLTMVGINQAIPTFEVNLTSSGDISSVTSLTSVIGAINPTTGALTASIPSTATIPALPILETTPPVISWVH